MVPKDMVKKSLKVNKPDKGGKAIKRPPVRIKTSTPRPTSVAAPRIPATLANAVPALKVSVTPPNLITVRDAPGKIRTLKKWCFDRTPVYASPNELRPSTQLYKGAVVELTGQKQSILSRDITTSRTQIAYKTYDSRAGTQWVTAWVNDAYLDDYNEKFPHSGVLIPNATADPNDAQQYMNLEGKTRYNMCGPLCVAFLVKDDIDSVLEKWKSNSLSTYNRVLAGGRDSGTSEIDLKNMVGAIKEGYGFGTDADQVLSFRERLSFPVNPTNMAQDLQRMLVTHSLIVLVTINKSGQLIANSEIPQIQHWVVLDKITRNGNRLEIYNPFSNRREECSFNEFYRSCRASWSGIWLKRKHQISGFSVESLPTFEVTIENPNPTYRAAQYLDIDNKKQTNLCGEFCAAFLVKDSIENVLKRWKEMQPKLYAASVAVNEGTGTFDLATILKMYGYNNEGDVIDFVKGLLDPYLKKYLHSPGRMAKMLETYFLIAGVNIDGVTGILKPGNNVRHWVVVDKITPVGKNGGWVELYNPFHNRWEEYSYREFENSVGVLQWAGLWVKRNIVPKFVEQAVEEPRDHVGQVHHHNPNRRKKRAVSDFIKKPTQGATAKNKTKARMRMKVEKKRPAKKPHIKPRPKRTAKKDRRS